MRPLEEVHTAHEVHHEFRRGVVEDLLGRAGLLDAGLVHDHHAVGHFERLLLVVGDQQAGDVDGVVQPPQPAPQPLADLGVERAEGLVEQQHLGFDGQGASQRHPLPLAAGELAGIAVGERFELDQRHQLPDALADGACGRAHLARADAQPEGDILEHVHVAEQRIVLEHETHAPLAGALAGDIAALEEQGAGRIGVRRFETRDDAQQRGFARAGRAQQGQQLAIVDRQADVAQGGEAAEGLGDVKGFYGQFMPPGWPPPAIPE